MPDKVDILLATFNGAAFLEKQIDSILEQSYPDFHLYIRDDGSADATIGIIDKYASAHPQKITFLESRNNGAGAKGNFSLLMQASTSPYIAFADQDDIWDTDKVAVTLAALKELDDGHKQIPCYVFTDLAMIDDEDGLIAGSLWQEEGLDPHKVNLSRLLVQNVPYGCTTMINRALLELASPIDPGALLHDHWLALLAASAGKISHYPRTTIRHRIHTGNASRSANPVRRNRQGGLIPVAAGKNFYPYFYSLQEQAKAVLLRLTERGQAPVSLPLLMDFAHLRDRSWLVRKWLMIRNGYFKHSWLQTFKWIIRA